MKNRIISHSAALVAAMLLLATACSKSGDGAGGGSGSASEVTFTTEITRAADVQTDFANGAQMSVWLAKTNNGSEAVHYTASCSGGTWKGSPKAIELNTNDQRYLLAIWPYTASATDANPLHYPVSIDAQTDILYSGTGVAVSRSKNSVKLTMRHALSIFTFDLESRTGGTLEQIEIGGAGFATKGELRVTSGKISATETGGSYTYKNTGRAGAPASIFVIPFSSLGNVELKLTIDGQIHTCALPSKTFDANCNYVLHLVQTDAGVSLLDIETIALDEVEGSFTAGNYGQLQITQRGGSFTLPTVAGAASITGTVYWDAADTGESYDAGKTHTFASDGEHRLTIDLWGASSVAFESLEGVEEIDLSKF